MPRQVRKVVSSAAVRTVAQTRAAAAAAASPRRATATTASAASSASRPTTRAALRKGPLQALQQGPVPAPPPGVRQLRSRQVPLSPSARGRCDSASEAAVNLIFVQGKRRRSRSVASSRGSESNCTAAAAVPASSSRVTRSTSSSSASAALPRTPKCPTSQKLVRGRVATPWVAPRRPAKTQSDPLMHCPICKERLSPGAIADHAKDCSVQLCPLAGVNTCQWTGTVSQSVDHIVKDHQFINCVTGPNSIIVLKSWRKAAPLYWNNLQTCLGHNFLVEIKKVERLDKHPYFYGVVRLFGHQEDADRFEYRMKMKAQGEKARVFSYSTMVRALHDENSVINEDSFKFDTCQAEIFSYEGNVEVEVSISVMKM